MVLNNDDSRLWVLERVSLNLSTNHITPSCSSWIMEKRISPEPVQPTIQCLVVPKALLIDVKLQCQIGWEQHTWIEKWDGSTTLPFSIQNRRPILTPCSLTTFNTSRMGFIEGRRERCGLEKRPTKMLAVRHKSRLLLLGKWCLLPIKNRFVWTIKYENDSIFS